MLSSGNFWSAGLKDVNGNIKSGERSYRRYTVLDLFDSVRLLHRTGVVLEPDVEYLCLDQVGVGITNTYAASSVFHRCVADNFLGYASLPVKVKARKRDCHVVFLPSTATWVLTLGLHGRLTD